MTPERLAEIEQLLDGREPCAVCGDVAEELLTALQEAQECARVHESNKETAIDEWQRVERERNVLQAQLDKAEAVVRAVEEEHLAEHQQSAEFVYGCEVCATLTASRERG